MPQDLLCKVQVVALGTGYVSRHAVVASSLEFVGVRGSVIQSTCQASIYF